MLLAAGSVHAAPSPYCPGTCDSGLACGSDGDCEGAECTFVDACLPGLSRLVAAVVPEGPGGLNDAANGWTCGLVTCEPDVDHLRFASDYGIAEVASKEIALEPGKRYLAVAEMRAAPGTWGYFDIASRDIAATSDPIVDEAWTRVTAFFEVPELHVGAIQFRLHADGPGALGIRRIALLELSDYGVFVRFTLVSPGAARLSPGPIQRHSADGPGYEPVACIGDPVPGCIDATLLAVDVDAGEPSRWLSVSRVFGAPRGRVTIPWLLTRDDAAVTGATVRVEVAFAPDPAAIVWSQERTLHGDRVGLVLPEGVPHPDDLASVPGFVGDAIARDRAVLTPAAARPAAYKVAATVATIDRFDAPSAVDGGLDLLADLGLNAASYFSKNPEPATRAKATTLGLVNRIVDAREVAADTIDYDLAAIRAHLVATFADPAWDSRAAADAERLLVMGRGRGLPLAGPAYRAAYVAWLEAEGVDATTLGLTSLDAAEPLDAMTPEAVVARRPDPSDAAAAHRYIYALRFWNVASAKVYALVREVFGERFGATSTALDSGAALITPSSQWSSGVDFQTLVKQRAVDAFFGDATFGGHDDCLAWRMGAYADYVAGITAPWREAAQARDERFPLATHVHADRGDVGAKLLELAARGFEWFDYFAYGPYDLAPRDGAGGLGPASATWLDRVARANTLLAKAEAHLHGATRAASPIVMLASQVDSVWTDAAALTNEEIGWHMALSQAHLPVDFMLEDEVAQGLLSNPLLERRVLLVMRKHVSRAAWQAIDRWVEDGGVLIIGGGLATHDEFGQYDQGRAEQALYFADEGGAGSETITWTNARGGASFAYSGAWSEVSSVVGTPIALAREGRVVAMRIPRSRGRIYALGLGLGAHYRLPETGCDMDRPATLPQPPSGFSKAMREVMSDLVTSAGVSAPLRSETATIALHRMVAADGSPLVLAVPHAVGEVALALTIPELARCEQVTELLEGFELPLTFGAILTTLRGPALFTWDRTQCAPEPEPDTGPEIAEPSPPRDEGCHGAGDAEAAALSTLGALAWLITWRRRRRSPRA